MKSLFALLTGILFSCAILPARAAHVAQSCAAPDELTRFQVALPHTTHAIRRGIALVIVTIGSSSTQGVGASDPTHTYPALLAEALRRRWPRLAIAVLNKGIGGETAKHMLARFRRDVLPYYPQLVIWQTGSNSTLANDDLQSYEQTIRTGLVQLQAAHADVILMDPQYAPRVLERPHHRDIVNTLARIGADSHIAVFRRFAVMQRWINTGQYSMEELITRDQLHMSDTSYTCIAHLLAESLASAVLLTPTQQSDAPSTTDSGRYVGLSTGLLLE